ncbi:hypothetical protein F5B19DRAFT_472963 [Rostrohypoxylon terebratum]|nr:hypothetical protein F5B19DRAFT_472963 [Rostrohypoxylon terebratum]
MPRQGNCRQRYPALLHVFARVMIAMIAATQVVLGNAPGLKVLIGMTKNRSQFAARVTVKPRPGHSPEGNERNGKKTWMDWLADWLTG